MSAGLPWTEQDDAILIEAVKAGDPDKIIARSLDRSLDSVAARTNQLRKAGRLPPARKGRRRKPVDFAQEVLTLGRKVPNGMRVLLRGGPTCTEIELIHPDGDVSHHSISHQLS